MIFFQAAKGPDGAGDKEEPLLEHRHRRRRFVGLNKISFRRKSEKMKARSCIKTKSAFGLF